MSQISEYYNINNINKDNDMIINTGSDKFCKYMQDYYGRELTEYIRLENTNEKLMKKLCKDQDEHEYRKILQKNAKKMMQLNNNYINKTANSCNYKKFPPYIKHMPRMRGEQKHDDNLIKTDEGYKSINTDPCVTGDAGSCSSTKNMKKTNRCNDHIIDDDNQIYQLVEKTNEIKPYDTINIIKDEFAPYNNNDNNLCFL